MTCKSNHVQRLQFGSANVDDGASGCRRRRRRPPTDRDQFLLGLVGRQPRLRASISANYCAHVVDGGDAPDVEQLVSVGSGTAAAAHEQLLLAASFTCRPPDRNQLISARWLSGHHQKDTTAGVSGSARAEL